MLGEARDREAHKFSRGRDNESDFFFFFTMSQHISPYIFVFLIIFLPSGMTEDMSSDIF